MSHYRSFLSPAITDFLIERSQPVPGVAKLRHIGDTGGLESEKSFSFLVELYELVSKELFQVLDQRKLDRDFIDQRTRALCEFNTEAGRQVGDGDYQTVLGLEDKDGRIVMGPLIRDYWKTTNQKPIAPLPTYLQGNHVTLFGPPDNAKTCINAMNAYHRQLKDEPQIVRDLLATHSSVPKWGADNEDSKTPLREDLISAGENLSRCFTRDLEVNEASSGKSYKLEAEKLALPIKRFPGLALPCSFLFYRNEPLPLHLYDFAMHLFQNWNRPEALVFYVPKLENEEEAHYIRALMNSAESLIQKLHPEYVIGTIRLMIVLENPRAVFRTHEMIDELHPYFAGASLGWHDYLASTARIFKEDENYRIPIKADPDIVIKYIKASHELLARVVGPRGGIKVGGMYGILPLSNDLKSPSFQVTMKGYIRDVVTQLKRHLDGFWVAHPDFVRIGLALVEAWKLSAQGDKQKLMDLVNALLEPEHRAEVLNFISGPDIESLDPHHPRYDRSLIVADLKVSDSMPNNDEREIRYNVFQSLQYLADWLSGNGCVALPTQVNGVAVRVMDDLATAERSRWEVWHEIRHKRFPIEDFLRIAFEEFHFIRKDLSDSKKIVQVKWDERTSRWYPIALKLMIQLMTHSKPAEFATELLMPLTMEAFRSAPDPWALLEKLDPEKYRLAPNIERFNHFFEICGHQGWASEMAKRLSLDGGFAESAIRAFSIADINQAGNFHGSIGESQATLDTRASSEQAAVLLCKAELRERLLKQGEEYRQKFGMKFLISAQGKSSAELLSALEQRMNNSASAEMENARTALWQITQKRLALHSAPSLYDKIEKLRIQHGVVGAQLALTRSSSFIESLCFGTLNRKEPVVPSTLFEIASLSKPVASAFAVEYFAKEGVSLDNPVNALFEKTSSKFRIRSRDDLPSDWASKVTIEHLLRHEALNHHYVKGVPSTDPMPPIAAFLEGNLRYGYEPIRVIAKPGERFHYSGGGFLVLEHLIESLAQRPLRELTQEFLQKLEIQDLTFVQSDLPGHQYAVGYSDTGAEVSGRRKMFPAFAAGAMGTARAMLKFLQQMSSSYANPATPSALSHDTAMLMLYGLDKGSGEFMAAKMGLGIFVTRAGANKIALHQGANDGFRCLFLQCFEGPNAGHGFVLLCNAELKGVQFISEVAQLLLKELEIEGVDSSKFKSSFNVAKLKSEEIVNRGYKELVFAAFEDCLPEAIPRRGPLDEFSRYNKVVGSRILNVSNQIFARAENLIAPEKAVFEADLYCAQGKVMDSWESARHNPREFEDLVLELPQASSLKYASISTAFHLGNQVPCVSLEASELGSQEWTQILGKTPLDGHSVKHIRLESSSRVFSQVRVKTYPDGGLTRLALYGDDLPSDHQKIFRSPAEAKSELYPEPIPQTHKPLKIPSHFLESETQRHLERVETGQEFNNASAHYGAQVLRCSNQHYGPVTQVISPFPPLHMFDGFESARSREPDHHEEVVLALALPRPISRIECDFTFFVNNNPREMKFEGRLGLGAWTDLTPRTFVKAFAGNKKIFKIENSSVCDQVRVNLYPDGGVHRVRVFCIK